MTMSVAVSAEHRRRRHAAHERSAAGYERAAEAHRLAAVFFQERADAGRSEWHRLAADADSAAAARELAVAAEQ